MAAMKTMGARVCGWAVAVALSGCFSLPAHAQKKPLPFEELLYTGRALPFYEPASGGFQSQLEQALRRANFAERMAQLAQGIRLRTNLAVGFASCGSPNATYQAASSRLTICYELMEQIAVFAREDTDFAMRLDRKRFAQLVDGTVWAIFLHELAHAMIDINRIPITGREEDVADQFALYFATKYLEPGGVPVVVPAAWYFRNLEKRRGEGNLQRQLADEHSLDGQRIYNLACWALGADPGRGQSAARFVGLPVERAERCGAEYARLEEGMRSRFKKYISFR